MSKSIVVCTLFLHLRARCCDAQCLSIQTRSFHVENESKRERLHVMKSWSSDMEASTKNIAVINIDLYEVGANQ